MRPLQGTQDPACTVKAGTEQEVQTTVEEQVAQLAMVAQLWQVEPDRAYPVKQLVQAVVDEQRLQPVRGTLQSTQDPELTTKLLLRQVKQVVLDEQVAQLGMRLLHKSHVPPLMPNDAFTHVEHVVEEEQVAQLAIRLLQGVQLVPVRAYPDWQTTHSAVADPRQEAHPTADVVEQQARVTWSSTVPAEQAEQAQ